MKDEINLPEYLRLIVDKTFQDNLAAIIAFMDNKNPSGWNWWIKQLKTGR